MSDTELSPVRPIRRNDSVRLLPRSSYGKRALLSTDRPNSRASHIAELMETAQINVAAESMDRAQSLMDDPDACRAELRTAMAVLLDGMEDVLLIVESRGRRLAAHCSEAASGEEQDDS